MTFTTLRLPEKGAQGIADAAGSASGQANVPGERPAPYRRVRSLMFLVLWATLTGALSGCVWAVDEDERHGYDRRDHRDYRDHDRDRDRDHDRDHDWYRGR